MIELFTYKWRLYLVVAREVPFVFVQRIILYVIYVGFVSVMTAEMFVSFSKSD